MKIFDKIYNWFFDRETDKEEEWEVPLRTSGARKPEPSTSRIERHKKLMSKWQRDFLNNSFGAIENDKSDYTHKVKYYKRKVKVFHGLQGFKWQYRAIRSRNHHGFRACMKRTGYIEITKEEYEVNAK